MRKAECLHERYRFKLQRLSSRVNSDWSASLSTLRAGLPASSPELEAAERAAAAARAFIPCNLQTPWARIGDYYGRAINGKAVREIMAFVDSANQYVMIIGRGTWQKGWRQVGELHQVCSMCINLFRVSQFTWKPILRS